MVFYLLKRHGSIPPLAHAGMHPLGTVFWAETSPAEGCESQRPLFPPPAPIEVEPRRLFSGSFGCAQALPGGGAAVTGLSHGSVLNPQLYAFLGEESGGCKLGSCHSGDTPCGLVGRDRSLITGSGDTPSSPPRGNSSTRPHSASAFLGCLCNPRDTMCPGFG